MKKNKQINHFLNDNERYRLICGDALEVFKTMPDKCVDAIICDPPYDVKVGDHGGSIARSGIIKKMSKNLKALDIDHGYDIKPFALEFQRLCRNGMNLFVWCNKLQIKDYFNLYVNEFGYNFEILTWHKTNAIPAYAHKFLTDTEFLLNFRTPGHINPKTYTDAITYYLSGINSKDKMLYKHPTIKPLDFMERIVRVCSDENDIILDCFMGSGTTGVAAVKNNRRFIGIEIVEEYKDISAKRIGEIAGPLYDENKETSIEDTNKKKFQFGIR